MCVVRSREWSDVVIMCDGAQLGSSAHWAGLGGATCCYSEALSLPSCCCCIYFYPPR